MWCIVTRPRTTAPTFSFLPPPHVRRHAEDRRLAATPSSSDPVSGSVSLSLSLPPSICGLVRLWRRLEHGRCWRRRHVYIYISIYLSTSTCPVSFAPNFNCNCKGAQ